METNTKLKTSNGSLHVLRRTFLAPLTLLLYFRGPRIWSLGFRIWDSLSLACKRLVGFLLGFHSYVASEILTVKAIG